MCSSPLPEGPANPVLTRMLAPAPYQMLEKEDESEGKRTKDGLYSHGTSDFVSRGIKIPSSEDKSEGGHYLLSSQEEEGRLRRMGEAGS